MGKYIALSTKEKEYIRTPIYYWHLDSGSINLPNKLIEIKELLKPNGTIKLDKINLLASWQIPRSLKKINKYGYRDDGAPGNFFLNKEDRNFQLIYYSQNNKKVILTLQKKKIDQKI